MQKENFLDPKTIIAIGFLVLSWMAWDHYMRKKYPPDLKQKTEKSATKSPSTKDQAKTKPLSFLKNPAQHKEQSLEFKGENTHIVFSSKGLGIKKLQLNKHYDRQKKAFIFSSPEKPLFSTSFFKNKESFVPFKIKKQGPLFIGSFSSLEGTIKKTVQVDDERFLLKVSVEFLPGQKSSLEGLSLSFSQALPKETKKGFFKLFFAYGQEAFKGFVAYEGNKRERLLDIEEDKSYKNTKMAMLGGKYFGKAFINKSLFLPSTFWTKDENRITTYVDYEFLRPLKPQKLEYMAFLGPKSLNNLQNLGGPAKEWLDFGFFGWMARPLLLFLKGLYSFCHNWGLAIILLTFFIRLCLLPINLKSYKSMKIMQKLQPQIKEMREIYKKDPKKMNAEIMALMKKHKANPLGGCLPLFLQLPIFFALYRVLGESIELYQSSFVLWIKDLSLKDPYYILPILGSAVFFVQQMITPMNLPKEQARLMKLMPLLFSVFMLNLPSGLTLYIFVTGLFGLAQQFFFVRLGLSHSKGGEDVKTV